MLERSLLGLAALLVATSCVPARTGRLPVATITRPQASLLRGLALTPPDATALPPARALRPGAPPFVAATRSGSDAGRAVECLTAAVYYEARSEPGDGQRAVAQVVLNRVRDRAFPASVCGVVYQRSAKGCQFSFACDGSTRYPIDRAAWDRARAIAGAAFGGAVYAPVGRATWYHTTAVSPWWAPGLSRIGQVGAHIFYGWRRAMADALTFRRHYAGVEPGAAPRLATVDEARSTAGITVQPAAAPAPRIAMASGVRIHRGTGGPMLQGGVAAEVGPELDDPPRRVDPI